MKQDVAHRIRPISKALNSGEALRLLNILLAEYKNSVPELVGWAEEALPQVMVVYNMLGKYWKRLCVEHVLKRLNKEIFRRTRSATFVPDTASCLRFVSAAALETSDDWLAGKAYLKIFS